MVKSCPITEWSVIWMPFEYRTKFCPVFRPPFEYRTGIQMVVWIPNYHLNTGHLNTGQVKVSYSDVSVIQMFVIQIPTVLHKSDFWIPTLYLRKTGIIMHSCPDVENFTSRAHESCDTDPPEATLVKFIQKIVVGIKLCLIVCCKTGWKVLKV